MPVKIERTQDVGSDREDGPKTGAPTVVICDDHPIVRELLVENLARTGRLGEVSAAADVEALLESVERDGPSVIVVDIELPADDGFNAIERAAEVEKSVRSVILSAHVDPELISEARRRGASGFVPKADAAEGLVEVIETVAGGGESFPAEERGGDRIDRLLSLSPREREILDLISDGESAEAIGEQLGIGRATVYTHVRNTMAKLGVRTRGEAIALSVRYSYLRPRY
ncbi:MAG: response regulator transcription factor [Solirubrobacterales bacterium]